ncbi:MAG TPA: hypothetical protein VD926_03635, partial [Acidimicrobiales bacterium]|nr:hypothetical protein [Acidimicrobiales bacterium]
MKSLVPQHHRGRWIAAIGVLSTLVAVLLITNGVDREALGEAYHAARDRPGPVAIAVGALALAFVVR